jgi:uncharacterized protein YbjQ (UPF0145 family)
MAECKECGIEMGFMDRQNAKSYNGQCRACTEKERVKQKLISQGVPEGNLQKQQQVTAEQKQADTKLREEIETILLTTETAPNLNITKRISIITSQAAFEINNFKDAFVGLMNPVKGRSNEMEKQIDELKDRALYDLQRKAYEASANGVVAVDLDISTVTVGSISMLMLVASGTAVIIED